MNRRTLGFIALAVSMLYGAGFAAFNPVPAAYATIGGAIVALLWISVGVFGKDARDDRPGPASAAPAPEDAPRPPYGTPPQDQP